MNKEFYIEFDTKDMPGKLVATKITIEKVILSDMQKPMNIALCTHPLYGKLCTYVKSNPERE